MASTTSYMKVCVKGRPGDGETISFDKNNHTIRVNQQDFTFDKVFGPDSSQKEFFTEAVAPMIDEVIEGGKATIIAYGRTETGKTYTMEGNFIPRKIKVSEELSDGIIPRALSKLFQSLGAKNKNWILKASNFETSGDEITDLLLLQTRTKKQKPTYSILDDEKGGAVVLGLKEESLSSMKDLYGLLSRRIKNNKRSHKIFRISLHMKETDEDEEFSKHGQLLFVDLAASQEVRERESRIVNRSLRAFDDAIEGLINNSVYIPYREDTLTKILRDSFCGKTTTCIIATISTHSNIKDTLETLNYVSRIKMIEIRNQDVDDISLQTEQLDLEPQSNRFSFIEANLENKEHFGIFISSKSSFKSDMEYKLKKVKYAFESFSSKLEKHPQSLPHQEEMSKTLLQVTEMKKFFESEEVLKFTKSLDEQQYEEKPKKCIIYAVEMWNYFKGYRDMVNYYIYDDKKYCDIWKRDIKTLESSEYEICRGSKIIKVEEGVVVDPISTMSYFHDDCSYIVFKSKLFRVGGSYYSSTDAREERKDGSPPLKYLHDATNRVGILDLKKIKINNQWVKGPKMNCPRSLAHLFKLKDKLYVAGGIFTRNEEVVKLFRFMEVLENGNWKVLPDHPRFAYDRPPNNDYFLSKIVTSVIEEKELILAGVIMYDYSKDYSFYTFKPDDASPMWKPYIRISKDIGTSLIIEESYLSPAVVSRNLMIWVCYNLENMLFVMDFESGSRFYLSLVDHSLVPRGDIQGSKPLLLKIDEDKFCMFWTVRHSEYLSGNEVYVGLHSTIFTLKSISEHPYIVIEVISSKFSLIPNISIHSLQAICIADIEDPMDFTPFI